MSESLVTSGYGIRQSATLLVALGCLVPRVASAADAALPQRNAFAADGPYPMSHHNPGQTDVTIIEGPTRGKQLTRSEARTVPVIWCSAPIVKRVGDHTTVIAGTPHGLAKIDATGEAFDLVSFMPYPGLEEEHAGTTREPPRGAQKFDWNADEDRFVESWFLEDIDNTDWMPPAISPQNGLAYFANKVDSTYEYLAIDWKTGDRVARWRFPDDSVLWNTWGGITTLLEDGDLLLGGFFSVKRYDIGHLR